MCIGVVVSPPEEIVWARFRRVSLFANHRYDSSSTRICSTSYVPPIKSALVVRVQQKRPRQLNFAYNTGIVSTTLTVTSAAVEVYIIQTMLIQL